MTKENQFTNKNMLHALLALEPELKGKAEKITNECLKTFKDKQTFFRSKHREYKPLDDDGFVYPAESHEMITTVTDKLLYVQEQLTDTIDCLWQKEHTNVATEASLKIGDIVIDGIPAPALLNLQARLLEIRKLYRAIPNLPAGQLWEKDAQFPNVWRTKSQTAKTKKTKRVIPLTAATKEHPETVTTVDEDVPVGLWTTIDREGTWSSAQKSEALARIDKLLAAVKVARQEANAAQVKKVYIAKTVFDYINNG